MWVQNISNPAFPGAFKKELSKAYRFQSTVTKMVSGLETAERRILEEDISSGTRKG